MTTDSTIITDTTIKPAAGAAPEPVEVKLGDKTFKVDPAVAKELADAQKSAADAGLAKAEVEKKLAEAVAAAKPEPKKQENHDDDLATQIFVDPTAALKRIADGIRTEVNAGLAVAKQQEAFWTDFYKSNPGLVEADIVVRAVLNREFDGMKAMTVDKASEHLAEATQKELLKLGITRKTGKSKPVGEGGNEPAHKGTKSTEGERPLTGGLTSILKDRAAARREAGTASTT